ncbi:hypothetical protein GGX14DRAFT_402278 [Mycena pura]|uniref:Uncharacterized protein n=1 Tax=Mycena pura TaxID=153505 RepID=A0AAD6Y5N4_9AGAR|nr:hypothetical protein GGX14DRAFT_402278 [Mycena pura]
MTLNVIHWYINAWAPHADARVAGPCAHSARATDCARPRAQHARPVLRRQLGHAHLVRKHGTGTRALGEAEVRVRGVGCRGAARWAEPGRVYDKRLLAHGRAGGERLCARPAEEDDHDKDEQQEGCSTEGAAEFRTKEGAGGVRSDCNKRGGSSWREGGRFERCWGVVREYWRRGGRWGVIRTLFTGPTYIGRTRAEHHKGADRRGVAGYKDIACNQIVLTRNKAVKYPAIGSQWKTVYRLRGHAYSYTLWPSVAERSLMSVRAAFAVSAAAVRLVVNCLGDAGVCMAEVDMASVEEYMHQYLSPAGMAHFLDSHLAVEYCSKDSTIGVNRLGSYASVRAIEDVGCVVASHSPIVRDIKGAPRSDANPSLSTQHQQPLMIMCSADKRNWLLTDEETENNSPQQQSCHRASDSWVFVRNSL